MQGGASMCRCRQSAQLPAAAVAALFSSSAPQQQEQAVAGLLLLLLARSQVKVAGKRKGLSAEATSRSSPMEATMALRLAFFSSPLACFLKDAP